MDLRKFALIYEYFSIPLKQGLRLLCSNTEEIPVWYFSIPLKQGLRRYRYR